MKALSLWQPWATLVAIGAKAVETRHWAAPSSLVGQTIAIHAAQNTMQLPLARQPAFAGALGGRDLPLGALVGTVRLVSCRPINRELVDELLDRDGGELAFGNYAYGRVAWMLDEPKALTVPVLWRGSQGVFTVPDEALGVLSVNEHQERLL